MARVELRKVSKWFGGTRVIRDVELDIAHGEFVVFVGPSGCGKSTLLRLVAGLEDITGGDLLIDGVRMNDALPSQRGIAMVFQSYALYPHMTVYENMAFGLKLARAGKAEIDARVREAARVLQIEHLLERKPRALSGGQRQRVAIGRAITRKPKVFLFDEPLSNLDAALRVQMRIEIARLKDEVDATMIYVTHDQVEAMTLADRIVVLQAGVIEQVGSPLELYHHPRNLFVGGFIGSPKMNFLRGTVAGIRDGVVSVRLGGGEALEVRVEPGHVAEGAPVTLGVRPEHFAVRQGGPLPGEVLVVEHLGGATFLHVKTGGGDMLTIQVDGDSPVRMHDRVGLQASPEDCHLFDQAGLAIPRATRHPLVGERAAAPRRAGGKEQP